MDPVFLEYVSDWFAAVARKVIAPHQYTHGPVIAVQALNEGIYSDGGYPLDQLHFDSAAIQLYQDFLRHRYQRIETYNDLTGLSLNNFSEVQPPRNWTPPATRQSLRPSLDWAEFHRFFYRELAATCINFLRNHGVEVPAVMNISPPSAARGAALKTFLGRYSPPCLADIIHYGYTNWCGVVAHNEDAWIKYRVVGKLGRGINMEENWGFDSYDPPYYWSVQTSFFQSLAYMLWAPPALTFISASPAIAGPTIWRLTPAVFTCTIVLSQKTASIARPLQPAINWAS